MTLFADRKGWFVGLIAVFSALALLAHARATHAQTPPECTDEGYVIAFSNGFGPQHGSVGSWSRALAGLRAMKELVGASYRGKPVAYALLYNHTDGYLNDLLQFENRAKSIDVSGRLARAGDLWADALRNDTTYLNRLKAVSDIATSTALDVAFHAVRDTIYSSGTGQWWSSARERAMTVEIEDHRRRIDDFSRNRKRQIFVGYSQGAIFARRGRDYAATLVGPDSVQAVHIAPAIFVGSDRYVLSSRDNVVNGIRLAWDAPRKTHDFAYSDIEARGHGLTEIYLNPAVGAPNDVLAMLRRAMDETQPPPCMRAYAYRGPQYNRWFTGSGLSLTGQVTGNVVLDIPAGFTGNVTRGDVVSLEFSDGTGSSVTYNKNDVYRFDVEFSRGSPVKWNVLLERNHPTPTVGGPFLKIQTLNMSSTRYAPQVNGVYVHDFVTILRIDYRSGFTMMNYNGATDRPGIWTVGPS